MKNILLRAFPASLLFIFFAAFTNAQSSRPDARGRPWRLDQSNLGIVFNEIARWTLPTLPAGWETLHDRWEWYHSLRTADSLLALACVW